MARILIIDDNETMREGMAATIRRMGHETLVAAGGVEGLTLMRKQAPDFLITDLKMEGVGGLEVVEAAKRIDASCPALIVTAFGTVETRSRRCDSAPWIFCRSRSRPRFCA